MNLTSWDLAVIRALILGQIDVLKNKADCTSVDEARLVYLEQLEGLKQTLHHVEEVRKCV